jgi:lipopolysaccharide/colanic/teichoic acid biosynthesis glycosyltransferase
MFRLRNFPTLAAATDSLVGLAIAVGAVVWARAGQIPHHGLTEFLFVRVTLLNASFSIVFAVLWKQCLTAFGLYRRDLDGMRSLVVRTVSASAIMTGLLGIYLQARHARGPQDEILLAFFATVFVYETLRVLLRSGERSWQIGEPERVIILGSGRRASKAWRQLRIQHHRTRQLLGFVDDRSPALMAPDIASRHICTLDDLSGFLLHHTVDELIVAVPMRSCYELAQRAVLIAQAAGVRVVCLNDLFALNPDRAADRQQTLFLELVPKNQRRQAAEAAKRLLDVLGAGSAMLLLSPVFLGISLAIKLTSPGSLFLAEERHGYGRRRFRMLRFRNPIAVTPVGRFLHRSLLDRMPALWNVLTGDMSLVGPRPMSAQEIARFGKAHLMRRFSVRPGMTGNWQTAGDPQQSLEEAVALDFSYIDHWSLALDFKILASSVPAMLKRL